MHTYQIGLSQTKTLRRRYGQLIVAWLRHIWPNGTKPLPDSILTYVALIYEQEVIRNTCHKIAVSMVTWEYSIIVIIVYK